MSRAVVAMVAIVAAAALSPVQAASSACLDFDVALSLARERDPEVAAARAERDIAAADLKESRSLYKPQFSAFGRTGVGDVGVIDSVFQNQIGLRASQRVFDFGDARYARLESAANVRAGEETIRSNQIDASLEAGLAYIDALDARARLSTTEQRTLYFERQLAALDAVIGIGGATRSERAEVAAELAEAQAFALEMRFLADSAKIQLDISTGAEPDVCSLENVEVFIDRMFADVGTIEDAVSSALAANPAVLALENRAESIEAARKRELRSRWPVISLVGIAAYSSTSADSDFELQDRVGIDITVPLYSGSAVSARADKAAARSAAARSEVSRLQRQLQEQVDILYQRIRAMREQLARREEAEDESKKQLEAAVIEYDSGARTLPDLIDVRLQYERLAIAKIALRHDLLRRKLELLAITSRLVGPGST